MKTYDFTDTFEELAGHLDGMRDVAEGMLIDIDDRSKIKFARFCVNKINELESLKKLATEFQERMEGIRDELCLDGGSTQTGKVKNGLRTIEVSVTEGMLRQSLLSLTAAKKENLVKLGEEFIIRPGNGTEFTTELVDPGNKLRERGRIRDLYEFHKVKAGDHVVLEECEKGVWEVRIVRQETVVSNLMQKYVNL